MAQFTLELPDELLPALVAEFSLVKDFTEAETPEAYFAASVVETVRQRAELYKVGPYFEGAVEPKFRIDGMPNPAYQGADAIVLPEPEPEIEEDPLDNDTNGDDE